MYSGVMGTVLHVTTPISRLLKGPVTVKTLEHPQFQVNRINVSLKSVSPGEGLRTDMADVE